ncbi:MAG TPA: ELWxxDGT repeat protein [Thermoanaerobaculia bacterium]|nr:ELWxxDGT repeat protein [Thermoanaerobaculia bacterium]
MKIRLAAVLTLAAIATFTPAFAQSPYLVADLNTTTPDGSSSSSPDQFQFLGDTLFFSAQTAEHGFKLWKHTAANGASMVAGEYWFPGLLKDIGNGVFLFEASGLNQGSALWRTDGTTGATLVKDIDPSTSGLDSSMTAVFGGKLYFDADDGVHGWEPWFSDGTTDGTQMLLDLNGTSASSGTNIIFTVDDRLFLFGGGAVWTSDGTAAGTTRIATVGSAAGIARIGSTLFFTATGPGGSGRELWKTDGTEQGTQMVMDIAPGSLSGLWSTSMLMPIGSTLYFTARTDGFSGIQLWKTDGTTGGTVFVKELLASGSGAPTAVTLPDGRLYIQIGGTIWRSDGTETGTVPLTDRAGDLVTAFGRLYYARNGETISGLWTSDGVTHSRVGANSQVYKLTSTGGKLYFSGRDQYGDEPWVSEDGTTATTHRLANINADLAASSTPETLTADGEILFFRANDGSSTKKLFRSDGTAGGTFSLTSTDVRELTSLQGSAWFGDMAEGLWRTDGTVVGTAMMKNFSEFSRPTLFFPGSRYLYFAAGSSRRVWRADASGVVSVTEGQTATNKIPSEARAFAELAGRVYIQTESSPYAIWVTEGNAATTERILPVPYSLGSFANLTTATGAVYFSTSPVTGGGHVLWRSDGTFQNGAPVKDVAGNEIANPTQLMAAGRYLYFVASDATHGAELWRSDGTQAGTFLVKDIALGEPSSAIALMTAAAGELVYFYANDGAHGGELWRSDGTAGGTVMVADLRPGSASSSPGSLEFAHGSLWFSADDGSAGRELWRIASDVPMMVADLVPGSGSSSPSEIEQAGDLLYFSAATSAGRELWAVPLDGAVLSIDDVRMSEGTGGTRTMRFTVTRSGDVAGTASVSFATGGGTASTSDYGTRSGTLAFANGQTTQLIDIVVQADAAIEGSEFFYVTLDSPSSVLLGKSVGLGSIDDDDQRAELTITAVPTGNKYRSFQIANAGPSAATGVVLRFSESPGAMSIALSGCISPGNPLMCNLATIPAGSTVNITVDPGGRAGYVNPNAHPGSTVTASVSAAEADSNPADNSVTNMFSYDGFGTLMLPPFLPINSGIHAKFYIDSSVTLSQPFGVVLTSSSPNVTVSPSSAIIQPGETLATLGLTVGGSAGSTRLVVQTSGGSQSSLVIPVVATGGTPKLDVAMVATTNVSVDFDEEAAIEAVIAARKHDGTLPTGTVSLLDVNLNIVEQKTLDGAAKAVFTQSDLPVGDHKFSVRYHGDANFNGLDGPEARIRVRGLRTTLSIAAAPVACTGATYEVIATVRSTETSEAPTGSVRFVRTAGTGEFNATLTPTGVPGESRATWSTSLASGFVSANYLPTGVFGSSSASKEVSAHSCVASSLQATATSPTSVTLNWAPIAGSTQYQVRRYASDLSWIMVGTSGSATTLTETDLTPMRSYLYVVSYSDINGNSLGSSAPDVATTLLFDDDPIVAGTTRVRAVHIEQLRIAANALRWYGLTKDISEIAPMPVGSPIRAEHIRTLRTDINAQRGALGLPVVAFTDPGLSAGAPIKRVHVEELRNAVK